ncbi:MAG TPA: RNA 2',3'-cyclic phosphodiesterase [Solirubrobacteraceae bacterium]|nr:RNA 2',3'-cyclic phosphodiesterase [Solirubrobacteraceae bacterium]
MSAGARLFVAADPPPSVCEQLARWARGALRAAHRPGLRVLDPERLHITLCFLGSRPLEEIDEIAAAVRACAAEAPLTAALSLGAPLWLPPRRPRVLAVEVHDPAGELADLAALITRRLQSQIDWTPQRGRFRPHLTVARLRAGAAPQRRELAFTPALDFDAEAVSLYRSYLRPSGSEYITIARVPE